MDFGAVYPDYLRDGCLKIENFLTLEEVEELKRGVEDVVNDVPKKQTYTFSPYDPSKNDDADDYYVNSGDKIRYFFEDDAFDENGKLVVDRKEALCKVAYALHWWNPIFKKYTFSQKVKELLRAFQYKDPVLIHSMLIFKKPKIGEIVKPHQDSTFLYTEPPTCIGLWFPLEDATLENGCLWFVPGSHKGDVTRRFVSNPKKPPMFVMEGKAPDYKDEDYVSVPAKKGDCVIIHGSVAHKSGRNLTTKARTVYTYHVVEKAAEWSPANWIQPTETLPFPSVYDN